MRSLLIAMLWASTAYADVATVDIDHTERPFKAGNKAPIAVSIGGSSHSVATGKKTAVDVEAGTLGRVVAIAVRIPGVAPITRWAAVVPGVRYTVRANPCSFWDLPTGDPSSEPDTYRVDATRLSAVHFPLTIHGETLAKPGVTRPFTVAASAMCLRSGADIVVRSGKRVVFEQSIIGHPGRAHTIALTDTGYTISIDPPAAK